MMLTWSCLVLMIVCAHELVHAVSLFSSEAISRTLNSRCAFLSLVKVKIHDY
jgi:hypothetical protein